MREFAFGHAAKVGGKIDIRTVSPTRSGAMVNAIYLAGYRPSNSWSEGHIEAAFETVRAASGVEIVAIEVNEVREAVDA